MSEVSDRLSILKVADVSATVPGGMNLFMLHSGAAVAALGHRVDYVFKEDLQPWLPSAVARRLVVPWLIAREVLRRTRRGERYDVVEIHEPVAAAYCWLRRHRLHGRLPPCVVVAHGVADRLWQAELDRWRVRGQCGRLRSRVLVPLTLLPQSRYALRHADRLLLSAEEDADYAAQALGIPGDRIDRMETGVDERYFDIDRSPRTDEFRIVFVGHWIDRKGTGELVSAWHSLRAGGRRIRLIVACSVKTEAEVLRSFGPSEDGLVVLPLMSDDELMRTLAGADVFVLPSWFEGGASLSAVQAAAAGLPCIVTDVGGHTALFRANDPEADGGVLVPPHDAEALAAAIDRLIADPNLADGLGRRARERARQFSWRATAEQSISAYRKATFA